MILTVCVFFIFCKDTFFSVLRERNGLTGVILQTYLKIFALD